MGEEEKTLKKTVVELFENLERNPDLSEGERKIQYKKRIPDFYVSGDLSKQRINALLTAAVGTVDSFLANPTLQLDTVFPADNWEIKAAVPAAVAAGDQPAVEAKEAELHKPAQAFKALVACHIKNGSTAQCRAMFIPEEKASREEQQQAAANLARLLNTENPHTHDYAFSVSDVIDCMSLLGPFTIENLVDIIKQYAPEPNAVLPLTAEQTAIRNVQTRLDGVFAPTQQFARSAQGLITPQFEVANNVELRTKNADIPLQAAFYRAKLSTVLTSPESAAWEKTRGMFEQLDDDKQVSLIHSFVRDLARFNEGHSHRMNWSGAGQSFSRKKSFAKRVEEHYESVLAHEKTQMRRDREYAKFIFDECKLAVASTQECLRDAGQLRRHFERQLTAASGVIAHKDSRTFMKRMERKPRSQALEKLSENQFLLKGQLNVYYHELKKAKSILERNIALLGGHPPHITSGNRNASLASMKATLKRVNLAISEHEKLINTDLKEVLTQALDVRIEEKLEVQFDSQNNPMAQYKTHIKGARRQGVEEADGLDEGAIEFANPDEDMTMPTLYEMAEEGGANIVLMDAKAPDGSPTTTVVGSADFTKKTTTYTMPELPKTQHGRMEAARIFVEALMNDRTEMYFQTQLRPVTERLEKEKENEFATQYKIAESKAIDEKKSNLPPPATTVPGLTADEVKKIKDETTAALKQDPNSLWSQSIEERAKKEIYQHPEFQRLASGKEPIFINGDVNSKESAEWVRFVKLQCLERGQSYKMNINVGHSYLTTYKLAIQKGDREFLAEYHGAKEPELPDSAIKKNLEKAQDESNELRGRALGR